MKPCALKWSAFALAVICLSAPEVQARGWQIDNEVAKRAFGRVEYDIAVVNPETGAYDERFFFFNMIAAKGVVGGNRYNYAFAVCDWYANHYAADGQWLGITWGYSPLSDVTVASDLSRAKARGPITLYETYGEGEGAVTREYVALIEFTIVGKGRTYRTTSTQSFESTTERSKVYNVVNYRSGAVKSVTFDGVSTGLKGGSVDLNVEQSTRYTYR